MITFDDLIEGHSGPTSRMIYSCGSTRRTHDHKNEKENNKMAKRYKPAYEVKEYAESIIEKHFADKGNADVPTIYLFISEAEKLQGREKLGTARKIPGREMHWIAEVVRATGPISEQSFITGPFLFDTQNDYLSPPEGFLITIHEGAWANLSDRGKAGLIHHELSHCIVERDKDGELKLQLVGHDLEEFRETVRIYGDYLGELAAFTEAIRKGQPSLFGVA